MKFPEQYPEAVEGCVEGRQKLRPSFGSPSTPLRFAQEVSFRYYCRAYNKRPPYANTAKTDRLSNKA